MSAFFLSTATAVASLVWALWLRLRPHRAARALGLSDSGHLRTSGRQRSPLTFLDRRLRAGAIALRLDTLLLLSVFGGVVCWTTARVVLGAGLPADVAVIGGGFAPMVWASREAEARREALAAELERVAAGLAGAARAGMNLYASISEVGVATGGSLGAELSRTLLDADQVGLSESLLLLGERVPLPDVRLLVAAMRLNQGAGAEAATAFDGLLTTLRERREAAAALRSATAAGRWQANVLVAVPPFLLAFMHLVYPQFEAPLLNTTHGRLLLGAAAVWVWIGQRIVRHMSTPPGVGTAVGLTTSTRTLSSAVVSPGAARNR